MLHPYRKKFSFFVAVCCWVVVFVVVVDINFPAQWVFNYHFLRHTYCCFSFFYWQWNDFLFYLRFITGQWKIIWKGKLFFDFCFYSTSSSFRKLCRYIYCEEEDFCTGKLIRVRFSFLFFISHCRGQFLENFHYFVWSEKSKRKSHFHQAFKDNFEFMYIQTKQTTRILFPI